MLKLRTKTVFNIPTKRGVTEGIIYFIIDKILVDANNITPKGYYYYLDENQQPIKLDDINTLKEWAIVEQVETNLLSELNSTTSLQANLQQRLQEFTMLQLEQENGENYGTLASDWEIWE
jgi:hypothetical protein